MLPREQFTEALGIEEIKAYARTIRAEDLLPLIEDEDAHVARNAAWIMTHKTDSELALLPQDRLIGIALSDSRTAVCRMVLNVIERQPMDAEALRSDFLDFCLSRMSDLDTPPGIQSLCMKLAYRMCQFYPELEHEFQETLNIMELDFYSPGVRCVIRKMKKKSPPPRR